MAGMTTQAVHTVHDGSGLHTINGDLTVNGNLQVLGNSTTTGFLNGVMQSDFDNSVYGHNALEYQIKEVQEENIRLKTRIEMLEANLVSSMELHSKLINEIRNDLGMNKSYEELRSPFNEDPNWMPF